MVVSARSKSVTGPWENSPYNPIVHTYSVTAVSYTHLADNVKYYVSADYMSQKGVLKGFNYKRYSIRTNIDMRCV